MQIGKDRVLENGLAGRPRVDYGALVSSRVIPRRTPPSSVLVGTDIVEIRTVEESLARFGDRYVSRVYTLEEARYCASAGSRAASRFAARFAAKEAAAKVLRLANDEVFDWRSIEVVRGDDGWCELRLHPLARRLARRAGLRAFAVSLSHEERYATAVVIAERSQRPRHAAGTRSRGS
jgi:holo-[acyl-carrier protein] synthase